MTDNQKEKINRAIQIRKQLHIRQEDFAKILGINRANLSSIENFRENRTLPNGTSYILEKELNLNPVWFETGEGEMFIRDIPQNKPRVEAKPLHLASDPNDYDNDGTPFEELPDGTIRMRVPIIPHRAYAGYLRGFQDQEFYDDLSTISIDVFKQHKGHYIAFEVNGDSMTTMDPDYFKDSIFDGTIAVGRELPRHQWQYKLHTHAYDSWVIVHKTEGILIKKIIKHDVENGYITIHSLNPNKDQYPDEELFLDDIEQIFNIVQTVNRR